MLGSRDASEKAKLLLAEDLVRFYPVPSHGRRDALSRYQRAAPVLEGRRVWRNLQVGPTALFSRCVIGRDASARLVATFWLHILDRRVTTPRDALRQSER